MQLVKIYILHVLHIYTEKIKTNMNNIIFIIYLELKKTISIFAIHFICQYMYLSDLHSATFNSIT